MKSNYNNEVLYFTFPVLEEYPELFHAMSSREGGISKGYYSSMNLGINTADEPENIRKNYEIFADAVSIDVNSITLAQITHSDNVLEITKAEMGCGITRDFTYNNVDALITNTPGITLAVTTADCVPVFFYDPVHKACGIAHSGWKGTANEISAHVVDMMKAKYDTNPEQLICCIGPCIGMCCYEVSKDVFEEFIEFDYLDEAWYFDKENGKFDIDLARIIFCTLLYSGVDADNIHVSGMCTSCNSDVFFSHRASHGKRGTMASMIGIRE